jgi:hypothetical protein
LQIGEESWGQRVLLCQSVPNALVIPPGEGINHHKEIKFPNIEWLSKILKKTIRRSLQGLVVGEVTTSIPFPTN